MNRNAVFCKFRISPRSAIETVTALARCSLIWRWWLSDTSNLSSFYRKINQSQSTPHRLYKLQIHYIPSALINWNLEGWGNYIVLNNLWLKRYIVYNKNDLGSLLIVGPQIDQGWQETEPMATDIGSRLICKSIVTWSFRMKLRFTRYI